MYAINHIESDKELLSANFTCFEDISALYLASQRKLPACLASELAIL